MPKKGMKRPNTTHTKKRNPVPPVPAIKSDTSDKPISKAYSEIDNDLARDNLENDISNADIQDL